MRAKLFAEENRKWWTLGAVAFGLFMIMLDNTVVNVALPTMKTDLHVSLSRLECVVVVENINWNWIFFINVPVGVLGIVASQIFIRESRDTSHEQSLDLPGLVTSALGLFSLSYALIEGNDKGWTSPEIIGFFVAAAVLLVAFVLLELYQRLPMLDLSLFKIGSFSGANTVAMLVSMGMFGVFFFVSLYIQDILGYSATEAGAMFLPMTVLIIVIAPIAGRLSDRIGPRWLMAGGMAIVGVSLLLYQRAGVGSDYWTLLPAMILGG